MLGRSLIALLWCCCVLLGTEAGYCTYYQKEQKRRERQIVSSYSYCSPGSGGVPKCGIGYQRRTIYFSVLEVVPVHQCCPGYKGQDCNIAVCSGGCGHGKCVTPGTCQCNPGWTGNSCDTFYCDQPCVHGSCTEPNQCTCELGWTGMDCSIDVDECSQNACPQICTNTPGSYQCSCWRGYEFPVDCIVYITNNSECLDIQNGTDYTSCVTVTVVEGEGHNDTCIDRMENTEMCIDINECTPGVAECSEVCVNTEGSFHCSCYDPGYKIAESGVNCTDIDECTEMHNGGCDHSCVNTVGSYNCSCDTGYRLGNDSHTCEDVDECVENKNVTCNQTCINIDGSYYCSCTQGYRFASDGYSCADIDECEERTSGCHDQCTNTIGSYYCSCPSGYELSSDLHACIDVNECSQNACPQNCTNTPGSYQCSCWRGYEFPVDCIVYSSNNNTCSDTQNDTDYSSCATVTVVEGEDSNDTCIDRVENTEMCIDINECTSGVAECSEVCVNTEGSFHCSCYAPGYKLNEDGVSCTDVDECSQNTCPQICTNTPGSYQCSCWRGYEFPVDCIVYTTNNSDCLALQNSTDYSSCLSVTVAKGNEDNDKCLEHKNITTMCTDMDECTPGVAECGQVCVNTEGSFHCSCYLGYKLTKDGVNCTDIDECTEMHNGGCDHSCVNTVGSYNCSCDTGYRLGNDSHTCEDVDECVENANVTCNQTCINIDGSYYCSCTQGYRLASDGYSCDDIDECEERTSGCHDQCTNTIGSYYCSCPSGYELSSDLHACIDINECSQNPCPQNCTNTPGSYQCSCWRGYEFPVDCIVRVANGSTCVGIQNDTDYTSCATVTVVEGEDSNDTCIDRVENTEMCIDINECTSGVAECSEVCVNTEGSFHCSCYDPGYKLNEDGVSCTDVDECSQNPCPQNCTNTPGSYQCSCWRGYQFPVDCIVHVSSNNTCSDIQNDTDYTSCATVTVVEGEDRNGTCIDRVENTEMCIDINECTSGVAECSEVCVNTEGSFHCSCYEPGYKLTEDGVNCTDVDECGQNPCPQNCTNTPGSYQCACWRGYEFPLDCIVYITNNSECLALQNSTDYSSCLSVTVAEENGENDKCLEHKNITTMCTDTDECTSGVAECGQVCVNTEGSFHCSCYSGYKLTEDGINCTDIDECLEMGNGGCDHSCVNTVGSYNCSCDTGYRLGNDSHTCEDIDECVEENNGGCNQTCINTPGSYYCSCRQEYRLTDDGHSCAIDECELGIDECHQVCIDTQESYSCGCISGYELDNDQLTCIDIDECEQNLASCVQGCDNLVGSFSCYCHSGFYPALDGASCIKIPSLDKLNITLPDPGLKTLLSYVTISDDYCADMQGIFITLKNFGYLSGYVTVGEGVLLARLNVSKELNAYDLLGGLFGDDHSIFLPVNSRIELIKYNCSSNEFSLKTLKGGKMNVFPHFLELSSVSLNITVVENIIPRLSAILFQGAWSIGSLSCNVSLDTTRTGQWPFQVACDHNQFNLNEFLEVINLEFKSFLPIELSFGLEHMNGTIYIQDGTMSILVELEGMVSIEDWLTVRGCIVVYQDIKLREPPQILIGSSCSSSGTMLSLSYLVQELMTGVDISNVPFFGDLALPEFRVVIPSVNTSIPDRFLLGSTMLRDLAKALKVANGITFVFKSPFANLPLNIALTVPSFEVAKLSFIPIPNPDIGKLNVRRLLETLVDDFIPPVFSGAISDLSVLDLNVDEFEFDLDQRIVKVMAMYNKRFSIFFNRIVIDNILTYMCLDLSTSELQVSLKGQFRIGPILIECDVAIDTAKNSFKLTAKSPKVCLGHIVEVLQISIPSIMVEKFELNTLCIRDVTVMLDSANGYTFCFCGTVSLWSRSIRLSVCTDHNNNLIIGFTLKAFSLSELLSKFVGSIARRIPLLNHILDISILFTDTEQNNILSSLQCVDMPTLYPMLAKPGLTIKGTATWPESCEILDIFCHVLKFFVGNVVLPFKIYLPKDAPSLPLISIDFTLPEFSIGPIRLNQPSLEINLPTLPSIPFSLAVSGTVNLLGLKFTAGVKYQPVPPSVSLFLHTKQSWSLVPFVESCNLFMSVSLFPIPSPIPGFAFGVDAKIGLKSCKRLEVRAIASYDPNGVDQSYFYSKMDMPLTIESILKAFCINIPLPSFIGDMGFPDGFIASYSQVDHYIPYFDLHISKGLYFKGTLSYWGARVAIEVKYIPGLPDYFYIKLRLPVVRLFGNALFMSESRGVRNKGPFLEVTIDSSVSGNASIFVNVLKISTETILSITGNEISFSISGSILGLFEAEVRLAGEYKSDLAAMNLNVVATLKSDFFNFITDKVKSIVSNIKKGADLITAPLEGAISAAQKVFDTAADGARVAADKVKGLEDKVGGARREVDRIRNKINSVCHTRSCGRVSWSYPCGVSCGGWSCRVKTCRGSATDPVCQAANAACRALKAPWEALLGPAEAALRGFEGLLSAARSALNRAQSLLRGASSGLDGAKRALDSAKSKLGSALNVVAAIIQRGINNLFGIHSVTLEGMLNAVGGGRFRASIDMTIIGKRIKANMELTLSNPTELINYAVNYIKSPFGRKKRSSLKPKWLMALLDQVELAKAPKAGKARYRSIDKVRRLAELSKMLGTGFPFINK